MKIETAVNLLDLADAHRAWSDATFGAKAERGPVGPLKHLAKEALEAAAEPGEIMEYVDCMFLFLDACHRAGWTPEDLVAAGRAKLEVLKLRHYPETPDGEPSEHDRSGETADAAVRD